MEMESSYQHGNIDLLSTVALENEIKRQNPVCPTKGWQREKVKTGLDLVLEVLRRSESCKVLEEFCARENNANPDSVKDLNEKNEQTSGTSRSLIIQQKIPNDDMTISDVNEIEYSGKIVDKSQTNAESNSDVPQKAALTHQGSTTNSVKTDHLTSTKLDHEACNQKGKKSGQKHYKCNLCDYGTNSYKLHKVHQRKHENGEIAVSDCTPVNSRSSVKRTKKTKDIPKVQQIEDKPFTCDKCAFRTTTMQKLERHLVIHVDDKQYACDACSFRSRTKAGVLRHMAKHKSHKLYNCDLCLYKATSEKELDEHQLTHLDDLSEDKEEALREANRKAILPKPTRRQRYKCAICDYSTPNADIFIKHWNRHTGEKYYKCDQCIYGTNNKSVFLCHQRLHLGVKPFQCDACGSRFTQLRGLKTHQKSNMCTPAAGSVINKVENVAPLHLVTRQSEKIKEKEEEVIEYEEKDETWCDHCQKAVTDYKTHYKTHKVTKTYKCDQCDFSSTRPSHLKRHKIIHTGEKPFKCDKCDYRANFKINLKTHQKVHSEEMPRKCEYCFYTTYREDHLKRHQARHRQTKLFHCEKCKYSTADEDLLKKHQMKHDTEITTEEDQIEKPINALKKYTVKPKEKVTVNSQSNVGEIGKAVLKKHLMKQKIQMTEGESNDKGENKTLVLKTHHKSPSDVLTKNLTDQGESRGLLWNKQMMNHTSVVPERKNPEEENQNYLLNLQRKNKGELVKEERQLQGETKGSLLRKQLMKDKERMLTGECNGYEEIQNQLGRKDTEIATEEHKLQGESIGFLLKKHLMKHKTEMIKEEPEEQSESQQNLLKKLKMEDCQALDINM